MCSSDLSKQAVSNWESGIREPSSETLIETLVKSEWLWARQLALLALHMRYPGVFINPKLERA